MLLSFKIMHALENVHNKEKFKINFLIFAD